ncbi:hypothetical protein ABPG75_005972 [Micractinium tetrahymenae]
METSSLNLASPAAAATAVSVPPPSPSFGAVSRRWHRLALSVPSLWRSLQLTLPPDSLVANSSSRTRPALPGAADPQEWLAAQRRLLDRVGGMVQCAGLRRNWRHRPHPLLALHPLFSMQPPPSQARTALLDDRQQLPGWAMALLQHLQPGVLTELSLGASLLSPAQLPSALLRFPGLLSLSLATDEPLPAAVPAAERLCMHCQSERLSATLLAAVAELTQLTSLEVETAAPPPAVSQLTALTSLQRLSLVDASWSERHPPLPPQLPAMTSYNIDCMRFGSSAPFQVGSSRLAVCTSEAPGRGAPHPACTVRISELRLGGSLQQLLGAAAGRQLASVPACVTVHGGLRSLNLYDQHITHLPDGPYLKGRSIFPMGTVGRIVHMPRPERLWLFDTRWMPEALQLLSARMPRLQIETECIDGFYDD